MNLSANLNIYRSSDKMFFYLLWT